MLQCFLTALPDPILVRPADWQGPWPSPYVLRDASIRRPVVDKGHAQADPPRLCLCNDPVQGCKDPLIKYACLWLQGIPFWPIACAPRE